jgi:hypothetical protein
VNLSDLSNSPYLASDDYAIGTILPLVAIERIVMEEVPTPGKTTKTPKAIAYFKGAKKGWCINKTEARKIGKAVGATTGIDKAWIGVQISLKVVGDVRRPDGTRGNAFRIEEVVVPPRSTPT